MCIHRRIRSGDARGPAIVLEHRAALPNPGFGYHPRRGYMSISWKRFAFASLALGLALSTGSFLPVASVTRAADHSEAPTADEDRPNDIGDVFAFLDPNDNSKVVITFTVVGFIV